jgi:chromosome partitioning protein
VKKIHFAAETRSSPSPRPITPHPIYAVVNQKGGVGKTTTAINLAAALAQTGEKVLLVDSDPQSNATSGLGVDKASITAGLYDVLVEGMAAADAILPSVAGIAGLDLLPATLDLSGAEVVLYSEQNFSRESVLRGALKPIVNLYDFVIIDGPPSLGLLTVNILTAASRLIIPIQCEYYALEGISQLLTVVERIRSGLNPALSIAMVALTMQDARTNLSQAVIAEVRGAFGELVARTVIPRNVRLSEAPSYGQPISIFDARSKGATAYRELATEVIERS